MAAPRLTFLWPFLFKPSAIQQTAVRTSRRTIGTSTRKRQEVSTQRYGSANEPVPGVQHKNARGAPSGPSTSTKSESKSKEHTRKAKAGSKQTAEDKPVPQADMPAAETSGSDKSSTPPGAPAVMSVDVPKQSTASNTPSQSSSSSPPSPSPSQSQHRALRGPDHEPPPTPAPPGPIVPPRNPLETVLHLPTNDSLEAAQIPPQAYTSPPSTIPDTPEHRPPHINTPRYVHHFDTYSLVRNLSSSGWTDEQAVTTMKAVRLILADNMDLARDGLVSKSNVENETYLFRAACSELRTEVEMRRRAETEKTRTERTGLLHELDILGQRLGMDVGGLKETLKGMTEARKMEVRDEGRGVESKIQELNYRITVTLNSDARSEVEGVRWIVTKRAITALAICVLMVLSSLKYASGVMQAEEEARKKREKMTNATPSSGGGNSGAGDAQGYMGAGGSATGAGTLGGAVQGALGGYDPSLMPRDGALGDIVVNQGDNPGYISLG